MPARPILTAPAFGQWLATQRGRRSYEAIASRLRPYVKDFGLKVDRSSVQKMETGRVPSWPMLWALSEIYRVPLPDMARQLLAVLLVLRADGTIVHLVPRQIRRDGDTDRHTATQAVSDAAHAGATATDILSGNKHVTPRTVRVPAVSKSDGQTDSVPSVSRATIRRAVADLERLARDSQQAAPVGKSARTKRAVGEHAAAPRASSPSRRPRARKHRR